MDFVEEGPIRRRLREKGFLKRSLLSSPELTPEAIWGSIKEITTRFPRHSMDLFVFAQEENKDAFLRQLGEIVTDVENLRSLAKALEA